MCCVAGRGCMEDVGDGTGSLGAKPGRTGAANAVLWHALAWEWCSAREQQAEHGTTEGRSQDSRFCMRDLNDACSKLPIGSRRCKAPMKSVVESSNYRGR